MGNIFMCLLLNLKAHGKIISALLKDEDYSSIKLVNNGEEYLVTVNRVSVKVEEDTNV